LDQCIQSVLAQTYPNIEYFILDNQSEDDSIAVAEKYTGAGVNICRNTFNIMNASYSVLMDNLSDKTSEYIMLLPADDYIEPEFIEKCVSLMEKYNNVGYVHAERDFVTENGELIELDPFYDRSFVVDGEQVMPIYMMTTVAHPAQALCRRSACRNIGGYAMPVDHSNADKALWFYLSTVSDYAYIREKLARIRIGTQTETMITNKNFQHPVLVYMTLLEFVDYAKRKGYTKVTERKDRALLKLASEFLSHAAAALFDGDTVLAGRYLTFCEIISRDIKKDAAYIEIDSMLASSEYDEVRLKSYCTLEMVRKRSYSPPDGYNELCIDRIGGVS